MAHVLLLTSDLASIVNAHAEVARRLRADGHEVTHLRTGHEVPDLAGRGWTLRAGASPSRGTGAATRSAAIDRLGLEAHRTALLDRAPDLVLVDIELHEQVAVALTLGVPVAATSTWIAPGRVRGLPPLDRPDPLPSDLRGVLTTELTWLRRRVTAQRPRLLAIARSRGADRQSVLHDFTRRHGVDLRALATTDAWLRPWGYDGLRTLVLGPAQLDLRADPSVTYVGPMVGPVDRVPLPASVAAGVERHRLGPGAGPLVYCSFGSFVASYDEALLGRLVAAVADEPSWTLLLALGGTRDPDSLGPLPDNVVAERWMPQRRVLDEADLAITHAGIMTILEGVLAGVPLLVRSAGLRDQDGNAARVVHHGLGRLLDREASASTIRDLVEEVRSDRLLADRVTTMRRELLRDDRTLERTVAELLAA